MARAACLAARKTLGGGEERVREMASFFLISSWREKKNVPEGVYSHDFHKVFCFCFGEDSACGDACVCKEDVQTTVLCHGFTNNLLYCCFIRCVE
jgi:hypothetical protein